MASVTLYEHQMQAARKARNGNIFCGGVGSGKSRTAMTYYYKQNGGNLATAKFMDAEVPYYILQLPRLTSTPMDLYIITTARKRDSKEWIGEMIPFGLDVEKDQYSLYSNKVVVDSWNNVGKYKDIHGAFFIFDEQRVVGKGAWVKSFLRIARFNQWIMLSATPGDCWNDYVPVFIANGYFRNRTQFNQEHCVWNTFGGYPKIERYLGERKLLQYKSEILIEMKFERQTVAHHEDIWTDYDAVLYKTLMKERFDIWNDKPFQNAAEFCAGLRKVVNSDSTRAQAVLDILKLHPRAIIFYNFDYELDILRSLPYQEGTIVAEWNGHRHEPVPSGHSHTRWVYLVQYTAGCEAWNCTTTDTMIFYSQTYSFKVLTQACGRIDRLNTPYKDLYYYHLKSHSSIDLSISRALVNKKKFNEQKFSKPFIFISKGEERHEAA